MTFQPEALAKNVDKSRRAIGFETPRIHKYGSQSCSVNSPLINSRFIRQSVLVYLKTKIDLQRGYSCVTTLYCFPSTH